MGFIYPLETAELLRTFVPQHLHQVPDRKDYLTEKRVQGNFCRTEWIINGHGGKPVTFLKAAQQPERQQNKVNRGLWTRSLLQGGNRPRRLLTRAQSYLLEGWLEHQNQEPQGQSPEPQMIAPKKKDWPQIQELTTRSWLDFRTAMDHWLCFALYFLPLGLSYICPPFHEDVWKADTVHSRFMVFSRP